MDNMVNYGSAEMGGASRAVSAVTVEGPLTQGVIRGFPSSCEGVSGRAPLSGASLGAFKLQLCSNVFSSFLTFFTCYSFKRGLPAAIEFMCCCYLIYLYGK